MNALFCEVEGGDHTAAGSTRRHWEWGLAWGAAVGTGEVWMGFWRQEMAFRMGGEFGGWALRWMRVIEEGQGQRSTAFPSLWKSEPKCESALK